MHRCSSRNGAGIAGGLRRMSSNLSSAKLFADAEAEERVAAEAQSTYKASPQTQQYENW